MSTSLPVRSDSLTVRARTLLSIALSRQKAFSIGLTFGLWWEEAQGRASHFDPFLHGGPLVAREVVQEDHVAGRSSGTRACATSSSLMGPFSTIGATMPAMCRTATSVVVLQEAHPQLT